MDKNDIYFNKQALYDYYCSDEEKDKLKALRYLVKFFNIPIDEKRIENYSISKIDFNVPSIELIDNWTNTTYISSFTYDAELLNCYAETYIYNSVIKQSPTYQTESLYYAGDKQPIIEKITFKNGEYDLVFEREFPNNVGHFIKDGVKFAVKYLKQLNYNGKNVKQLLLTKIYKDKNFAGYGNKTFEQSYTYGPGSYVKCNNVQDKYTFGEKSNVIYGVNELKQKDCKYSLRGICFENMVVNSDFNSYFPHAMKSENYPEIYNGHTTSAMMFNGFVGDCRHSIEIYKNNSIIHIKYHVVRINYNNSTNDIIIDQDLYLPLLNPGSIYNEEIRTILTTLQEQYSNDEFINLISNELTTFGKKIDIRKGIVEEENDMLNPKLFINKSFDDISELINANKEVYFELISRQFESATNIDLKEEKGFSKVLEPNNTKKC